MVESSAVGVGGPFAICPPYGVDEEFLIGLHPSGQVGAIYH